MCKPAVTGVDGTVYDVLLLNVAQIFFDFFFPLSFNMCQAHQQDDKTVQKSQPL